MASCSKAVKEAEGDTTNGPNWLDLPREITANILQKLDALDVVTSASQVCSLWWKTCKNPLMWRTIVMTKHANYLNSKLVEICRSAIDRSCGHPERISIEYFATDDLLKYIADDRASNLQSMQLPRCYEISDEGISEVAQKLPQLEFLDISFTALSVHSLEAIGSCSSLKALKFNSALAASIFENFVDDDEAFAIAKTMPELHLLRIGGNSMSNDGLLAILDGCPLLKSLDLRGCMNVHLDGGLEKRCHDQIESIRLPLDFEIKIPDARPSGSVPYNFSLEDILKSMPSEEEMLKFVESISGPDDEFGF